MCSAEMLFHGFLVFNLSVFFREDVANRKVSTQSIESEQSDHQSGESSPNLSSPRRQGRLPVSLHCIFLVNDYCVTRNETEK